MSGGGSLELQGSTTEFQPEIVRGQVGTEDVRDIPEGQADLTIRMEGAEEKVGGWYPQWEQR